MSNLKFLITLIYLGLFLASSGQQPFTAGNIVVYRVGDGSAALNDDTYNAQKVFLDEYTPSGVLVQSILMPVSGNQKLTNDAQDFDYGGMLTLSSNGKYLVVPGFSADLGTFFLTDRSVGLVDFNGALNNVTVVPNPDFNPFTSAISDNGINLWLAGGDGIEYTTSGSSSSIKILDYGFSSYTEAVNIVNGQLYVDHISSIPNSIGQVGTGLPLTSGQTFAELPGIGSIDPYQFAFADMDPNIPGMDVLYVASQASPGGGIKKYSLVGGTWVSNGAVGSETDKYAGLTIKASGNVVTVFATRQGANSSNIRGGELVSLTDNSGYNQTITGTPVVIASVTTPDTKAFRGVVRVPQPAPFTAGNIVVYRVGDGSAALNDDTYNAQKVFLDEYTPSGVLVQSILMPVSGNQKLTNDAQDFDYGGMLTLSSNGKYLVVPGFSADLGTFFLTDRSVGLVDFNGALNNVTVVPNPDFNPFTSAISDNGINLWLAGGDGIEYTTSGSSSSIKILDYGFSSYTEAVNIVNGQLYVDHISSIPNSIGQVGTGLPLTSGQTFAELPGIGSIDPYQFAFADMDPNIPGMDVLYVASQASPGGGIKKYSLVGGTWVSNGAVGSETDKYAGLTIKASGNVVTVFATRQGANSSNIRGGELVSLTDNSGYNQTITGTPVVIASVTTPDTKAFRGVTRVPSGCPPVTGLQATNITSSQATLSWNAVSVGTNYEFTIDTTATPPISGTATVNIDTTVTGLSNGLTYYVHVRTRCSALSSSEWLTIQFVTSCKPPAVSLLNIGVSGIGVATIKWNKVFGAASYEYFISTSQNPPASGYPVNDTSISISSLNPLTQYYVHVRSNCGAGAFSNWITKSFTTACFMPVINVVSLPNHAEASWNNVHNAVKYEYALTYTAAKPLSGTYTIDTFYVMNKLMDGSAYYFHVRSICVGGAISDWNTINFQIQGLQVYPNPVNEALYINLNGLGNAKGQITIADAMGRVVKQVPLINNTVTIDTKTWTAGIYLIRYDDGQNKYIVRIMKE